MGKRVRLMTGAAGMVPALGLAMAAPAAAAPAAAAPAAHAPGKRVSLHTSHAAGHSAATTSCTFSSSPHSSNGVTASSSHLKIGVVEKSGCVLQVNGFLLNTARGGIGDTMRTRVFDGRSKIFSGRATFISSAFSSGGSGATQAVGLIGTRACITVFAFHHPRRRVAGPVCAKF